MFTSSYLSPNTLIFSVSGDGTSHVNLLQYIFGTSWVLAVINSLFILIVVYVLFRFLLRPIGELIFDLLDFHHLGKRKLVFLELRPLVNSGDTIIGMSQMIVGIHGLLNSRSYRDRLLRRKHIISTEIVSTRADGIRFIVSLSKVDLSLFKQLVISYYPDTKMREIKDYLSPKIFKSNCQIIGFKQANHFAYRLARQDKLNQHDSMSYIAGSMTKPLPDEIIAYQLVLAPALSREISKVRGQLLRGQDSSLYRRFWHFPFVFIWKIVKFFLFGINMIFGLIVGMSPLASNKKRNGITPETR